MSVQNVRIRRIQILGRRKIRTTSYNASPNGVPFKSARDERDDEYSTRLNYIFEHIGNVPGQIPNMIEIESWKMENDKCYIIWTVNRDWASSVAFPIDLNQWGNGNGYEEYI